MNARPAMRSIGASSVAGGADASHFACRDHAVILVARENARIQHLAKRLRREAGVTVDILRADLNDEVDLALVATRLRDDGRIGVLLNHLGAAFMVAFSTARDGEDPTIDHAPL
jgi:short-subunit dehydrogenase